MGNESRPQSGLSSREIVGNRASLQAHRTTGHGARLQKCRGLWVTEPGSGPRGLWVMYHPPVLTPEALTGQAILAPGSPFSGLRDPPPGIHPLVLHLSGHLRSQASPVPT